MILFAAFIFPIKEQFCIIAFLNSSNISFFSFSLTENMKNDYTLLHVIFIFLWVDLKQLFSVVLYAFNEQYMYIYKKT